jgi:hypothetical protein
VLESDRLDMIFRKFSNADVSSVGPVKSSVARSIRGTSPLVRVQLGTAVVDEAF